MEFYSEPITVKFPVEPLLEKKPGLPAEFIWRGKPYKIITLLKEWHTDSGSVFDIYYDRSPTGQKKKGEWVLLKKVEEK